jgi:uncharacterized protein YegP (UPF0339 family)
MATAAMKARARADANGGTVVAAESTSMEFLIIEDNGGHYHWTLLDHDGHSLARSPNFASYQNAEDAAGDVLAGVGSARLERRAAAGGPVPSDTKIRTTGHNGRGPG